MSGDIGYWLSFGAFAGILLVVPLVHTTFWPNKSPAAVMEIAVEALVAELVTLPIILLFFGNLSLLGLLANVVVVPLIPLAMVLVAIAGFTDMLVPGLASVAAIPAHGILALIVWLIQAISSVPWASIEVHIGVPALIAWYGMLAVVVTIAWWRLKHSERRVALEHQIV